jgi:hypothetical protein
MKVGSDPSERSRAHLQDKHDPSQASVPPLDLLRAQTSCNLGRIQERAATITTTRAVQCAHGLLPCTASCDPVGVAPP